MDHRYTFIKDLQEQGLTYIEAFETLGYKKFFVPTDYKSMVEGKTIRIKGQIIKSIIMDWFRAFNVAYRLNYTLLQYKIEILSKWLSNPRNENDNEYSKKEFEWLETSEKLQKLIDQYHIRPPYTINKYELPKGIIKLFS